MSVVVAVIKLETSVHDIQNGSHTVIQRYRTVEVSGRIEVELRLSLWTVSDTDEPRNQRALVIGVRWARSALHARRSTRQISSATLGLPVTAASQVESQLCVEVGSCQGAMLSMTCWKGNSRKVISETVGSCQAAVMVVV